MRRGALIYLAWPIVRARTGLSFVCEASPRSRARPRALRIAGMTRAAGPLIEREWCSMSDRKDTMARLCFVGGTPDEAGCVLVLEEIGGARLIPIFAGASEGQAIALKI